MNEWICKDCICWKNDDKHLLTSHYCCFLLYHSSSSKCFFLIILFTLSLFMLPTFTITMETLALHVSQEFHHCICCPAPTCHSQVYGKHAPHSTPSFEQMLLHPVCRWSASLKWSSVPKRWGTETQCLSESQTHLMYYIILLVVANTIYNI